MCSDSAALEKLAVLATSINVRISSKSIMCLPFVTNLKSRRILYDYYLNNIRNFSYFNTFINDLFIDSSLILTLVLTLYRVKQNRFSGTTGTDFSGNCTKSNVFIPKMLY